jgi:hypothetical protein
LAHCQCGKVQLTRKLGAKHCQFFHCQKKQTNDLGREPSLCLLKPLMISALIAFNDFCLDIKVVGSRVYSILEGHNAGV